MMNLGKKNQDFIEHFLKLIDLTVSIYFDKLQKVYWKVIEGVKLIKNLSLAIHEHEIGDKSDKNIIIHKFLDKKKQFQFNKIEINFNQNTIKSISCFSINMKLFYWN